MNPLSLEVAEPADFLATADRIAHRICRDAVWAADACTWLEWTHEHNRRESAKVFATVGADLYGGTAGISLFLSRFVQVCPSRQMEVVLRGAVEHALAGLASPAAPAAGLYSGAAGICFAVIEAGVALSDEPLVNRGLRELAAVAEQQPQVRALDVIAGSAGLISLLLDAAGRFDQETALTRAIGHGDYLIDRAAKSDDGWSWSTLSDTTKRNATGFAHGAAGIANALLELHQQTGETRFLDAARQGWRYERAHFCRDQNNWTDVRFPESADQQPRCAVAWCHGAAGIGLSRLRAWELGHHDVEVAEEIEAALLATRAWLRSHDQARTDFSLCHGMAGNAELFIAAAQVLDRPELYEIAAEVGRLGMQRYEQPGHPWPCGGTAVGETPNLMLGLAGIGMFYLRLHRSAEVASVLLVRPTRRHGDYSADS